MNIFKNVLILLLLLSAIKISNAQMLTVDRCFSGTNYESYSSSFKMKEDDSIRYLIIESNSTDNFYDSSYYVNEPYGKWLVALNENTRQTTRKYIGNAGLPTIVGNELFFTRTSQGPSPLFRSEIYYFRMDRNLNNIGSEVLIDTFFPPYTKVLGYFFTKDDSLVNLFLYKDDTLPHDEIHRYKFNNNGELISFNYINTLRVLSGATVNTQIKVCNNKIYEFQNNLLKVYDAEANVLTSTQLLNDDSIKNVFFNVQSDSSVFIKIISNKTYLNLINIKNNTIAYNLHIPYVISNRGDSLKHLSYGDILYGNQDIIDTNLVVPLIDLDSLYYIRYDWNGNVIHRYSEKHGNSQGLYLKVENYINSTKIVLKAKGYGYNVVYVQKLDNNGVPLSSLQINQTIFYQNNIMTLDNAFKLFKTKQNRYFIEAQYKDLLNRSYNVLIEYKPLNNTLVLMAVYSSSDIVKDIFSNDNYEIFVLENATNGCSQNDDVVLYKLANGINTVQGKIYIDYNSNNTQDNGEPNYESGQLTYTKNNISYGAYLIDTGKYTFIIDTGKYDVKFKTLDSIFNVTPANKVVNHANYNNTDVINFILKPIGVVYDAKIVMNNTFVTRPGFSGTYAVTYSNNGNQPINNFTIKLLLDNRLIPDSSNIAYLTNNDTLIWNITSTLQAGEFRTFYINFTAVAPPTLNGNDLLESIISIYIPQQDTVLTNNEFKFTEFTRGSYDPNEKTVTDDKLSIIDVTNNKSLLYTIRFENVGTDSAFNITIIDTLPNNTDINSFRPIASSHPYTLTVKDKNILTFYFKNIRLPYKSINTAKAHGFVSYEIKPAKNVVINDKIKNTAHIIFDYNLPISTNTATTTIQIVSNTNINKSLQNKILIYPNPAKEQIEIQFKSLKLNNAIIKLMDISGNVILSQNISQDFLNMDVSQLASGTYIIVFENEHQIQTSKLIITR